MWGLVSLYPAFLLCSRARHGKGQEMRVACYTLPSRHLFVDLGRGVRHFGDNVGDGVPASGPGRLTEYGFLVAPVLHRPLLKQRAGSPKACRRYPEGGSAPLSRD